MRLWRPLHLFKGSGASTRQAMVYSVRSLGPSSKPFTHFRNILREYWEETMSHEFRPEMQMCTKKMFLSFSFCAVKSEKPQNFQRPFYGTLGFGFVMLSANDFHFCKYRTLIKDSLPCTVSSMRAKFAGIETRKKMVRKQSVNSVQRKFVEPESSFVRPTTERRSYVRSSRKNSLKVLNLRKGS